MGWQTQRRYLHFTLNSCHSHSASPFLYWIVISMVCIENYVCNEITNNSLNAKEYANYIAMLDLKAEAQVQWALSRRDVPEQTKWKQEKNMSSDRIIVLEAIKSKQQIFELRPDKASVYMFVYAPIHSNTRTLTAPWTTFIQHTCSHTHTLEWGAVGEISRFHHYYCSCFSCSYHYNYDFGLLYFKKVHIFFSALVRALNLPLSLWENYQHRCPFPISRCSHIVHHASIRVAKRNSIFFKLKMEKSAYHSLLLLFLPPEKKLECVFDESVVVVVGSYLQRMTWFIRIYICWLYSPSFGLQLDFRVSFWLLRLDKNQIRQPSATNKLTDNHSKCIRAFGVMITENIQMATKKR